jgi:protein phosphatase-4 regulatory subunit 3
LDEEMLKNLVSKGKELERPKAEGERMDVDQPSDASHQNGSAKRSISEAELKRRREVLLLIQQLCVMGKNVQLPARMALFRTLCDRGILFSVQWGLDQPDSDPEGLQMISAAGEILTTLLDHDLNGVRNHVLKQLGPIDDKNPTRKIEHDTVLSVMCRVLVRSRDLAVQSQISESIRAIMEIPQDNGMEHVRHIHFHKILAYRDLSRWVLKSSNDQKTIRGQSASWTTSTSTASTCYFIRCSILRISRM